MMAFSRPCLRRQISAPHPQRADPQETSANRGQSTLLTQAPNYRYLFIKESANGEVANLLGEAVPEAVIRQLPDIPVPIK